MMKLTQHYVSTFYVVSPASSPSAIHKAKSQLFINGYKMSKYLPVHHYQKAGVGVLFALCWLVLGSCFTSAAQNYWLTGSFSVMELESRKVSISYCCLLRQVMDHLQFPPPVYELVDIHKNHVKLHVETTDLGFSHTYTFDGGEGEKLEASSEKAAKDAVRHFEARQKHDALESKERLLQKPPVNWLSAFPEKAGAKDVFIDYLDVLHVLTVETCARVSTTESSELALQGYVAWLTVYCPGETVNMECINSDICVGEAAVRQNAVVKVVSFLQCRYRIEIIDLNYGHEKYAGIKCSLARESYMSAQERVLGVQGTLHLAPFLDEHECSTPRSLCNKIPSASLPPNTPRKRRARPTFKRTGASNQPPALNFVRVPSDLEAVFKRRKRN
uniref:Uncharacterized protein n=1 Tax=Chenopodium quinoa TaxID=63459 RepID=A0A803MEH6_CHEQI